ncbi:MULTISPECIES: TetR/AcrR family transcriptional regulator [unclassified Amycolatopsis]|uniref:TetR/AcrR family transcriptional regulator n=1 Tax=unclassified Amycolatopsis TaxID=2618356 RepID=UPI000F79764F|nr:MULTISPECIES: TetR/AcrR family transcriptional regulator [unclassified Amycolatopsis]RSN19239.1 TetR family transcriptional regulator [Amycolatopsis sp. WAC 04169]UMP04482.1 TetR/AcrR family transcriptional regulator [Amycolatopsis sp. EV170708-02-1]
MAPSTSGKPRSRLTTAERREQLLRIGARLFAERPYDDVWIEQVADIAEVSRGLLYHYFPTKRDFVTEVIRSQGERLLEMTKSDPTLPVEEQLTAGLDAYLRYVEANEDGYRALHSGTSIAVDGVREVLDNNFAEQGRRILEVLCPDGEPPEALRVLVRGWLAFVVAVCLDWLKYRRLTREEIRDLCAKALLDIVDLPT